MVFYSAEEFLNLTIKTFGDIPTSLKQRLSPLKGSLINFKENNKNISLVKDHVSLLRLVEISNVYDFETLAPKCLSSNGSRMVHSKTFYMYLDTCVSLDFISTRLNHAIRLRRSVSNSFMRHYPGCTDYFDPIYHSALYAAILNFYSNVLSVSFLVFDEKVEYTLPVNISKLYKNIELLVKKPDDNKVVKLYE